VKVTVLGAGAWGTSLAKILHENSHAVSLWAHDAQLLQDIRKSRENTRYLPGISLPSDWKLEANLEGSVQDADCVVVAVPSQAFREVTKNLANYSGVVASVTKGIEYETGLTMCGVLRQNAPHCVPCAFSGPTLAMEVARGVPTAIVAASSDSAAAQLVQTLFHRPAFRVYTSGDALGVELGGALKNVVAIAAGIGDGLGFGDNSKAALITRGIAEMRRLGVSCGAQSETFSGLSGLGDLTVTCCSRLSRNRGLGERLGRGEKLEHILANTVAIAEGYPTARSSYFLARRLDVETPIIDEVFALLYQGKNVAKALLDLTHREMKSED
jgi:glycerol-3-phosphate dehydrogenase (NAD(P)+)